MSGKMTSTGLTTTSYNPSVSKSIDWEPKPIYRKCGVSNSVFSTLNWYFAYFNSQIQGQVGEEENVSVYSCEELGL